MKNLPALRHPETDDVWPRLTSAERREAEAWIQIFLRLDSTRDKGAEMALCIRDYSGRLRGLSQTSVYRRQAAFRTEGVRGILSAATLRRVSADVAVPTLLPPKFVEHLQGLCGLHQRQKFRSVYGALFAQLLSGAVLPGYDMDWRGIWLSEHTGSALPARCPYRIGGAHPAGWSERNLARLKPLKDVWDGAAMGAGAMRAWLPSVPHTRVGLEFCTLFVVDDVVHDNKINFLGQAQAQRPLELGMMECLTGRFVSWGVVPVKLDEITGARQMIKERYMRYLLVDLLCRVGVSEQGCCILAEHGTAAIRGGLLQEINAEIERLTGRAGFLRVETSATLGAPLVAGLFAERPRGNPKFKAMLESTWNLLHNELAMLPGQVGKDRDHSPQDITGRDRENALLAPVAHALAQEDPEAARALVAPYVNYFDFTRAVAQVKSRIEHRHDHRLEGWQRCGFTRQVAHISGVDVDLDAHAADHPDTLEGLLKLIELQRSPVRCEPLSPAEAWHRCARDTRLVRFPMSLAAVILGEALGTRCDVSAQGTVSARHEFTGETTVFNAIVTDSRGCEIALPRGAGCIVALNPFDASTAIVSDSDGRYLGVTRAYVAAIHGDREADKRNLALYQQAAAEQRRRLGPVIAEQVKRRREQVEAAAGVLSSMPGFAAASKADVLPPDAIADLWQDTPEDEFGLGILAAATH